jgi:tetratricopeptide (TPR) repeat protein
MAWAALGNLYKQKKDLAKSIDAYEHAVQLIKKDKVIWENLGSGYANFRDASGKATRLDDALKALGTASQLDPKDAEIRYKLGTVRRQTGDYNGAITDLETAIKIKGDQADWHHNLGVAYRYAKRDDDAIKAFARAIELSPNEATYHFDLGVAYRRKQLPDKAIPEYEKATSLDPKNADGWFDLGYMYKLDHRNDDAIKAFNKYLELKGCDGQDQQRAKEEIAAVGGDAKCGGKGTSKKGGGGKPK